VISELVIGELVDITCLPCSDHSPGLLGSLMGALGWGAASQDAPVSDSDLPPSSGEGPSGSDIATDVATGLGSDAALEAAAHVAGATGAAGGMLSVLGAVVSGSQSLAEGITTILHNDGIGLGGSSKGGKAGMDLAMGHINHTQGGVE